MTNNNYSIERGEKEDIATIAEFQIRMASETENLKLNREDVLQGVRRIFDEPERGFYLMVRDQSDQPLSCLLIQKEWSDWRNADVWWIHSVYVVPEQRGKGIFRYMFNHIENLAHQSNVKGLRLFVDKSNVNAIHSYKKLGMTSKHYELFEKMF